MLHGAPSYNRSIRLQMAGLAGLLTVAGAFTASAEQDGDVPLVAQGDTVYSVLPAGAIPAIENPHLVSAADADSFMLADEPILAVVSGDESRAYSLWLLDSHEIVNDVVGGTALAATW